MARLTAPNGSTVNVSDEKAKALLSRGYKSVDSGEKKAPAKKAAASSKTSKK